MNLLALASGPKWAVRLESRAVYAVFPRFTTAFTGTVSVQPLYDEGMRWSLSLLLALFVIAVFTLSNDARALGGDLAMWVHGAFVVVFVDAANFLKGCF